VCQKASLKSKQMEQAIAEARSATKTELLTKAKDVVNQLFEIGFDYGLVENGGEKSTRVCGNCGKPGHSKRTCNVAGGAK